MTKQEHINYWIEQAEDSWESADVLISNKRYLERKTEIVLTIKKCLQELLQ